MLNLSDNELDRLSREAASQHDPGDLMGPQSWERLELRLDKELGRAGPDMSRGIRGIRRFPFQYAPVLLLVVGVTWYFVKAKGRKTESSGSPPLTAVKTPQQQLPGTASDSSLKNSAYSDKSTSTFYPGGDSLSGTTSVAPTATASSPSAATQPSAGASSSSSVRASSSSSAGAGSSSDVKDRVASRADKAASGSDRTSSGQDHASSRQELGSGLANNSRPGKSSSGVANDVSGPNRTASGLANASGVNASGANSSGVNSSGANNTAGLTNHGSRKYPGNGNPSGKGNGYSGDAGHRPRGITSQASADDQTTLHDQPLQGRPGRLTQAPSDKPSDPERVFIQQPFTLRSHPRTSDITLRADSALRAYAARNQADQAHKPGPALHINRALGIGILFAPDFTSVNALAGDKPGSTLGLTLDYEVLDHLHLGTGILFSRRNYTARGMDYHVPDDYYRMNGMKPVDFVKGTMNMLEIPINIRYDFSTTPGGTSFFATVGASSYLFGKENCNYYYDFFGGEACRKFQYSNTPNGLFSSVNLSLGVETKISNSVYALIAPYMKLPTSDMGFGKVKMNSVGINFAIRYTPVLSRTRKY